MQTYIPGQRWISDTESELGLGTLREVQGRTVTIAFPASGETRCYALDNAPLSRAQFSPGDVVESENGWRLRIEEVREEHGLLTYRGTREDGRSPAELPEGELSSFLQFRSPRDRLLAGQVDPHHWFDLRYRTLHNLARIEQSEVRGLLGARIDPIPHQLYIAHEVARRPAPRVLLADEVGLGKTIEACLILHHQLLTHRATRVLILVPEPLLHQWLVELLRRFNLRFSLFDEERCQAVEASGVAANPFHAEQLVLCALSLLLANPERRDQVLAGGWDLLVVDEAHHLAWSEEQASPEYLLVEALAATTRGLLLLTATPEQLGQAGHFARLRLLDPDRFYDLQAFRAEEGEYRPVAEAVDLLLRQTELPEPTVGLLLEALNEPTGEDLLEVVNDLRQGSGERQAARDQLIRLLLDRHGTGRVLFRNTRNAVKGFPPRELHPTPLPVPEAYQVLEWDPLTDDTATARWLTPERRYQDTQPDRPWWELDPRVPWLVHTLRRLAGAKMLVICANAATARELEQALRTREGIYCAVFHEGMRILERDRAAAWFADPAGARMLVCSEIGSEGRNFQFSHHLVLFDLPWNPDLLEQRIGRLDRIGQRETVRIHVPYLYPGPQEALFRWYHEGLDAFSHPCPSASATFVRLKPALLQALEESYGEAQTLDELLAITRSLTEESNAALRRGRDHLLELSSCRQPQAGLLAGKIAEIDRDPELAEYIERVFDAYGVELEAHSERSYLARPSEHMRSEDFPGLGEDGLTFTYHRSTALVREDYAFLTWEHPMVTAWVERLQGEETGNSTLSLLQGHGLPSGTLLLEALYVLDPVAPRHLRAGRFLPPTLIRVLLDERGRDRDQALPYSRVQELAKPVERSLAVQVIRQSRECLVALLETVARLAEGRKTTLLNASLRHMMEDYTAEIRRLQALRQVNPNVREEEVQSLQREGMLLHRHIQAAHLRLDALRVLVAG